MFKKKESLGVIIVNYNSGKLLKNCIDSILKNNTIEELDLRIVIVDNASKDKSLDFNSVNDEKVITIKNDVNKGFGAACNQGIRILSNTDYILFLNPDTLVNINTFKKSIEFLKQKPDISILGVMHKDEEGKIKTSCSRKPVTKRVFWDIIGVSKVFPKVFKPATLMSDFDHKSSKFVDQVMGAYMFMKKEVVNDVKGFDENFFVYYEDADFSLRASNLGYKSYYNSDIEIIHHGRGTTAKISDISLFYNLRSRIQFITKHEGKFYGNIILFLTLTIEPITRLLYNLFFNPKENENTLKAFKRLFKSL